ncbi:MAG TPA: RpiB/LacA/LacB family sugar-phosphate isomerase [Candidatus Nanoarchaeia archaeon]|nr:RpiB/LacA/LacB family sugar-phosphate isomerase [Candidatus Nanoarchaeia archaeon]
MGLERVIQEGVIIPIGDHLGKSIVLFSDHRGFALKQRVKEHLLNKGYAQTINLETPFVNDVGCRTDLRCNYPMFAREACTHLANSPFEDEANGGKTHDVIGIGICGSGIGIGIPSMKYQGVYPARCLTADDAVWSRRFGNSNLLTLSADRLNSEGASKEDALEIVDSWLNTPFVPEKFLLQRHISIAVNEQEAIYKRTCAYPNNRKMPFSGDFLRRRLIIGSDSEGYSLKRRIIDYLRSEKGFAQGSSLAESRLFDAGCDGRKECDYPEFSNRIAVEISDSFLKFPEILKDAESQVVGIAVCESGNGAAAVAGKYQGVYPAVCVDSADAVSCRRHNNANLLCLSLGKLDKDKALLIVDEWLKTPFGVSTDDPAYIDRFRQTMRIEASIAQRPI